MPPCLQRVKQFIPTLTIHSSPSLAHSRIISFPKIFQYAMKAHHLGLSCRPKSISSCASSSSSHPGLLSIDASSLEVNRRDTFLFGGTASLPVTAPAPMPPLVLVPPLLLLRRRPPAMPSPRALYQIGSLLPFLAELHSLAKWPIFPQV